MRPTRSRRRRGRILTALIAVTLAYAATIAWISQAIVAPPRIRIADSARPVLGVVLRNLEGGGVVAARTIPPASTSGLRDGDRLVSIDGRPVERAIDVVGILEGASDGEPFRVEAIRPGPGGDDVAVLADVPVAIRPISPLDVGLPHEQIAFTDRDGRILRGWYIPPPPGAFRAPGIVHAHGNGSDRRQGLPAARVFHEAGFAQVLFDFAGRGESDGDRITLGAQEADGIRAAITMLADRPEVDGTRTAIVGHSMGASAAILAAAEDGRVRALVLDSPYTSLVDVVDDNLRQFWIPPALVRGPLLAVVAVRARFEPRDVRPIDAIAKLSIPILLVHGDRDDIVPFEHARALAAAAGPGILFEPLPGLGHNSPRPADLDDRFASFLVTATR